MDAVEKTTTAIASRPEGGISGDRLREAEPRLETGPRAAAAVAATTGPAAGDWAGLVRTGLAWLEQLAMVAAGSSDGRVDGLRLVHRDPQTGEDYVRIPMPSSEVLDGALRTIGGLLDRFRR